MKLVHLSDLHIGKTVCGFSMINDQQFILNQIIGIIKSEGAEGVMISGDVYDKSTPSNIAISVLDDFFTALNALNIPIFIISGNHDSHELLSFGRRIFEKSNFYISPVIKGDENGKICPITKIDLTDDYGDISIYLMPFIRASSVRKYFDEGVVTNTNTAVKAVIDNTEIDDTKRNVILSHQFITNASPCDSEDILVGTSDSVSAEVFDKFDYVALGHLHNPQSVLRDTLRYCGTPLKYSFSEANSQKSVTVVELKEKGNVIISEIPLTPLHDMRILKGSYLDVSSAKNYDEKSRYDYLDIILTDDDEEIGRYEKLKVIYPNIMHFEYDNIRTKKYNQIDAADNDKIKSPLELMAELYKLQNNTDLSDEQQKIVYDLLSEEEIL